MTKMQKLLSMILFGAFFTMNASATGCPTCGGKNDLNYVNPYYQDRILADEQDLGSAYGKMAGAAGMQGMDGLQSGLGVNPIIFGAQQGDDQLGIRRKVGKNLKWGDWRDWRDRNDWGDRRGWNDWNDWRGRNDWNDWRRGGRWGGDGRRYDRDFFDTNRLGDMMKLRDIMGQGQDANQGLKFPQWNTNWQGGMMPFNQYGQGGMLPFNQYGQGGMLPFNQYGQGGMLPFNQYGQGGMLPFNQFPYMNMMGQADLGQNRMFKYRDFGRRHRRHGRGGIGKLGDWRREARWGDRGRRRHRDIFNMMRQGDMMGQDQGLGQYNMMDQFPQMNMMGQDADMGQLGMEQGAWMRNQKHKGFGDRNIKIGESQRAQKDYKIPQNIKIAQDTNKADKGDKVAASTVQF